MAEASLRASTWVALRPYLAALASAIMPGAGQLMAGRQRRGISLLAVSGVLVGACIWLATLGQGTFLVWTVQPVALNWMLVANGLLLGFRVFAVVDAYLGVDRRLPSAGVAVAAGGLTVAAIVLVVLPHVLAGWYETLWRDTLDEVFAGPTTTAPPLTSAPTSSSAPTTTRPGATTTLTSPPSTTTSTVPPRLWDGKERLNVLLLGGDAGVGRTGVRTDTTIVASIDPASGHTMLISVPRNLARVPLPPDLDIWSCDCFPPIINELWTYGEAHPDRFPGTGPPGAEALKLAIGELTGLPIHYYALVNLDGFVDVIDALGGVDIVVPERLYDPAYPHEDGSYEVIDIQPGEYHMDGHTALAYARSRTSSDDYDRMGRQRCVLDAVVAQSSPTKLLRGFPALTRAMKRSVSTDIPLGQLPDIVELVPLVDADQILSIRLIPSRFTGARTPEGYNTPDVVEIQHVIARAAELPPAEAIVELGLEDVQAECG